ENIRGNILLSEAIVGSARYRYAGRLDLVYEVPGEGAAMIDIKRTYSPPASGGPQTAAQVLAFLEPDGEPGGILPEAAKMPRYLLHIKDGRCTLVPQRNKDDFKVFLAALTVTHWRMKNGKHL